MIVEQTSDILLSFTDSNEHIITTYLEKIIDVPEEHYQPFLEYVSEKYNLNLNNYHEYKIARILLVKFILNN